MLEKIKNLKIKGEILKALISISDNENEIKDFKKSLAQIKNELLKMLDSFSSKTTKQESSIQKNLDDILKENSIENF